MAKARTKAKATGSGKPSKQWISPRQFSIYLKVRPQSVSQAIAEGRLKKSLKRNEKDTRWLVDWKKGEVEWKKNTIKSSSAANGRKSANKQKQQKDRTATETLAKARMSKMELETLKLQLEIDERQGVLVKKDNVYQQLFAFGKHLREQMQQIPDRVIDEIMGSRSRVDGLRILTTAIDDALRELSETKKILKP
jgi:hypothetical protein